VDLSEAASELYAAPPDEFMKVRSAQVAEAKQAGQKDLAKSIGQLRKPTRSAWLVNRLAREAPTELKELLDLGASLREAQAALDGAELRRLSNLRSRVIAALTHRAVELGASADYVATDAVQQEVSQTLQAALADPQLTAEVEQGTLSSAISYGGFGPFELTAPAPTKAPTKKASTAEPAAADQDQEIDQEAAEAARKVLEAWELARDQLTEAEAEADRATAEADALADQVDELRRSLDEAEKAEAEARRTARAARKRAEELSADERSARQAAADAGVSTPS
jgi:hypothetical protein